MEKTKISLVPNGPIIVDGEFTVTGIDGKILDTKEKVYLCRCGQSSKKPFCDGTHKTCGFKD
ncbi:MAG: CDGSH iron-sulfur domain-containing protein [Ignavibacteriales bacterium]|jgi:CDGSH-type Zn-finger protein|nr:CDGSH iron-sulfur domain-containing protein [Ignavibacteriaceae bacterium]NLH61924.1 CDGSH iron-sulfur domain-containing protein [Ignavibacteriales bacterium]HOJ17215.1 CDGSH iron-sulfur domain-containing protein [Ignavibacteriaceae bacterium]HPO54404.1 CDGSH iron-sulfur domain-containing protein [Ignavibacteriaceae bacterium]